MRLQRDLKPPTKSFGYLSSVEDVTLFARTLPPIATADGGTAAPLDLPSRPCRSDFLADRLGHHQTRVCAHVIGSFVTSRTV